MEVVLHTQHTNESINYLIKFIMIDIDTSTSETEGESLNWTL